MFSNVKLTVHRAGQLSNIGQDSLLSFGSSILSRDCTEAPLLSQGQGEQPWTLEGLPPIRVPHCGPYI